MKPIFFLILIPILLLHISAIRNVRRTEFRSVKTTVLKDKAALIQYITKLKMTNFPSDTNYDASKGEYTKAENINGIAELDAKEIEKDVKWTSVKTSFLVKDESTNTYIPENVEIMKKFLHLRLADVIATVKLVFSTKDGYDTTGLTPNVFVGLQTDFDTPRVKVKLGATSETVVEGTYNFRAMVCIF